MTKDEFFEAYCAWCGSQRCNGPGNEFADGCSYYRELCLGEDQNESKTDY